jgi:hypothetical protein
MAKQTKKLSLDPEAIARGERYSKLHGTSVSQLVNRFLLGLSIGDEGQNNFSPTVRRLIGVAPSKDGVKEHRQHLVEKYGR